MERDILKLDTTGSTVMIMVDNIATIQVQKERGMAKVTMVSGLEIQLNEEKTDQLLAQLDIDHVPSDQKETEDDESE